MNYAAPSSEGNGPDLACRLAQRPDGPDGMGWAPACGASCLYGILHASSAAPDNAKPASATLRLLHVKWWTGDG